MKKAKNFYRFFALFLAVIFVCGTLSVTPVFAATDAVEEIFPNRGSDASSGYTKGTVTLTYTIETTDWYKIVYFYDSDSPVSNGLMRIRGPKTENLTLYNNEYSSNSYTVYLTPGTYTVTILRYDDQNNTNPSIYYYYSVQISH